MPILEFHEAKWIRLFDDLRCDPHLKGRIAGLFLSVPATDARSILYVGKATAGEWYRDDSVIGPPFPADEQTNNARVRKRHELTKEFIEGTAKECSRGGFWPFARELNAAMASRWGSPTENSLRHITWTNICKIGTLKGNPGGPLFEKQRGLALETLRQEIELYRPRLICFVTWSYKWELVKEVVGQPLDESWDQTLNEDWMWSRAATGELPAVLLTGHPQAKSREHRRKWVKKAVELLDDAQYSYSAGSGG
jgi:hypothetical protein